MKTAHHRNSFRFVCIAAALTALASGNLPSASAQTCVQPPSGIAAWFPGDGNALDLQGGDSASLNGNPNAGTIVAGKVGQALQFNGTGDLRVVDQPALNPTAGVTIEAWINPSVADGSYSMIAFKGNAGSK